MKSKKQESNTSAKAKNEENKIVAGEEKQELGLTVYIRGINEVLDNFHEMLIAIKNNQRKLEDKNLEEFKLVMAHFKDQSQTIMEQLSEIAERK